ncbi:MAG: DNA-binding protein [Spirochaetales bacterium]|nr:DNA-binding protein [Spirochaetales bacterium]
MEIIKGKTESTLIFIRFDPKEDLMDGLKKIIEQEHIAAGVVLSGIGCFAKCRIHQVDVSETPDLLNRKQAYRELSGGWEIGSIQGIIADGEPHLHVTLSEGDKTVSGHLEPGSIVFTLIELSILKADAAMHRVISAGPEKIKQLTKKE